MAELEDLALSASQALLSAALGGLLCLATSACGGSTSPASSGTAASTVSPSSTSGAASSSATSTGSASSASSTTVAVDPDTPRPDTTCPGPEVANRAVTSSTVVANLTQAQFTSECTAQNGLFELQPNCSGSNACRGMSYDTDTQTLIQHSCRGLNSCAGYSCLICD